MNKYEKLGYLTSPFRIFHLIENNLIKKYQPKYNILLKDGKTYPSIVITKEYYPRIFKTRVINKKFGTYYGPFSHIGTMYALLDIIKKVYKPRTCRLPLTEEGIRQKRYSPCLDYHIKNCYGACIGKLPHQIMQFDLEKEFPILTTKFVAFKTAVKEILWIWQKQSNDVRELQKWNCHVWVELFLISEYLFCYLSAIFVDIYV